MSTQDDLLTFLKNNGFTSEQAEKIHEVIGMNLSEDLIYLDKKTIDGFDFLEPVDRKLLWSLVCYAWRELSSDELQKSIEVLNGEDRKMIEEMLNNTDTSMSMMTLQTDWRERVKLFEQLVGYLVDHTLDRRWYAFRQQIKKIRGYMKLMTDYADIPEVWIDQLRMTLRNIHVALADAYIEFNESDLFSDDAKRTALNAKGELREQCLVTGDELYRWCQVYPKELEFVFRKMRCVGFSNVERWGVTDCVQFAGLDGVNRNIEALDDVKVKNDIKSVLDMCKDQEQRLSICKIYQDNDVYSMDLRREVVELYKYMHSGAYLSSNFSVEIELGLLLQEMADNLWGWAPKTTIVKVTDAPGSKATILNGTYVDTGEKGIQKKLFKKTSMFRGIQPILRINSQKRWIVSEYDKGDNGFSLSLQKIEKGKDVFMEEIKWEVYDVDKKKDWKTYPDMTATVISGSDLVWTLDDCDVVIKKVAEDMVVSWMHKCSEMYREHLEVADDRVVQHLDTMNWILHKMIQSHQTEQGDEGDMQGVCIICHENPVTEVLLPCRHVCFCSVCIKHKEYTGQCPICRKSVEVACNAHVYRTRISGSANKLFYQAAPRSIESQVASLRALIRELHVNM